MATANAAGSRRKPRARRTTISAWKLPESLTIRDATALAASMRSACADGVPVLDGSAVAEADTAGMQVLACVAAMAREGKRNLEWSAVSPALLGTASILGLQVQLGLPAAACTTGTATGQG